MSSSIRERIIAYLATYLAEITTTNGYNTNLGNLVERARTKLFESELPALSIFPGVESSSVLYKSRVNTMPIQIEGSHLLPSGINSSTQSELILADIIHNVLGRTYTIPFDTGTSPIAIGDTIIGATTSTNAIVLTVTVTSGSWAAHNAAGTLRVRDLRGLGFNGTEILKVGSVVSATSTATHTIQARYGGLIDSIAYFSGGTEKYPEPGETVIQVRTVFNFQYKTSIDNPYV